MKHKEKIRANFRKAVFTRDKHTCLVCKTIKAEEELDAHHITDRKKMPNGGYVESNGATVCQKECHMKVEQFHISGGESWEDGLHPDDLYRMIGSSYEKAVKDSEKLK